MFSLEPVGVPPLVVTAVGLKSFRPGGRTHAESNGGKTSDRQSQRTPNGLGERSSGCGKATITGLGLNEVQPELAPEPSKTLEAIESPAAIVEPEQNIELVPDEFTEQVSPPIPQTLQAETGEGEEDLIDKTVVEIPADEVEAKLIDESVLQGNKLNKVRCQKALIIN